MSSALMSNYAPLPVSFVSGHGATLVDDTGTEYLDALGGIAVCVLGHAHPAVQAAITDQAGRVIHTSNLYRIPLQEQLADKLAAHSGMEKVFFANSGAEANEAAIKLARLHAHHRNIKSPVIVVMKNSFHGRTMATLSATGSAKVHKGFDPLVEGFIHIPYNDIDALNKLAATHNDIVAVMVEPIQGEGGINIPDKGYLQVVRAFCDQQQALMIVDEVQTGMCRTGKWFAFQHEDVMPDVMTLAKALANGVPIGACLARGHAAQLFQPGSHGSTFGGNPLAARAGLAVIEVLEQEQMDKRAAELGKRLLDGFTNEFAGVDAVVDIRGRGMMLGIELDHDCAKLVEHALHKNLLINVTAGRVIRLLPPLVMTDAEADLVVTRLGEVVKSYLHNKS